MGLSADWQTQLQQQWFLNLNSATEKMVCTHSPFCFFGFAPPIKTVLVCGQKGKQALLGEHAALKSNVLAAHQMLKFVFFCEKGLQMAQSEGEQCSCIVFWFAK